MPTEWMTRSWVNMTERKIKYIQYIVGAVLATLAFVAISEVSQSYSDILQNLTEQAGLIGIVSYIGIMIISIVVAPIGTGFLLPVAANSWGPVTAAIYSITGWTIGAMIAFFLAKKYGLKLVKNVKTVQRLRAIEKAIPRRNAFLAVVLLRIALPVDLLSYALGIFSSMGYGMFFWSTVIGISPFAFIVTYAATSSVTLRIVVSALGSLVMFVGVYYVFSYSKSRKIKENDLVN